MSVAVKLVALEELDTHVGYAFHVDGVEGLRPRDLTAGDRVRIGDSEYSLVAAYGGRAGTPFSVLVENRVIVDVEDS